MIRLHGTRKAGKIYWYLHILFWLAVAFSVFHQLSEQYPGEAFVNMATTDINEMFALLSVYGVIYIFVPRYFSLSRLPAFTGFSVLYILVCSVLRAAVQDGFFYFTTHRRLFSYKILVTGSFIDYSIYTLVFLAIVALPRAYRAEQLNKRLEKERLENELSFLKAQINPHFLFNTINSIYVLIGEDKKRAAYTLLTFSNMLRYQLYECNMPLVSLEQEIKYLESYISLMKMRSEGLTVAFHAPAELPSVSIAPFLLIVFAENAFKHLAPAGGMGKMIDVRIAATWQHCEFLVVNTYDRDVVETGRKGIGLQNVRRRLSLLYPQRHTICVSQNKGLYSVNLKIDFTDD